MNMQDSKSHLTKNAKDGLGKSFLTLLLKDIALLLDMLAPAFIGGLCGHVWGSVAAMGNIIGWVYFGLKSRMAPASRIIWLVAFAFVVLVAVVEFAHLYHWQITSSGRF
jgi:hypothetical protein